MGEHHTWFDFLPGLKSLENSLAPALGVAPQHGAYTLWHVVMAIFVVLLVTALLVRAGFNRIPPEDRIVPEDRLTLRTCFELVLEAIRGMGKDIIGEKHIDYFLPLLGTLAIFIFFSNIMGLVPGMAPPTSTINTTLACAVPVFLLTHYVGVKEHGLGYFKHFLGPIIAWYALPLMLIMLIIELISHLARLLSLSMRLFGNMFGDHLVLAKFMGLLVVPLIYPVPIMVLGVMVAVVQTLVFCLLSMVYFGLAVAHEDH